MITYGIDPGARTGVAVFNGSRFLRAEAFRPKTPLDLVPHVERAKSEGAILIIERQFLGRGNPKSMAELVVRRAEWQTVAALHGVEYELVYPASWQTQLAAVKSAGNTKAQSKKLAAMLYGGNACKWDAETADAALIARWWITEGRYR